MTSHPPRRSSGRDGSISQSSPLRSVRLKLTVADADPKELARRAADKGLAVEADAGRASLVIPEGTPEDALAKLALFSAILASRT